MRKLLYSAAALSALLLGSTAAEAGFTLCNVSGKTMRYAMVYETGFIPFASTWTAEGWRLLEPGCRTIITGDTRHQVFLSVQEMTPEGPRLNVYPTEVRTSGEVRRTGIERIFCVKSGSFKRTLKQLSQHEDCPDGWYEQVFNYQVFVPTYTNYRLEVN